MAILPLAARCFVSGRLDRIACSKLFSFAHGLLLAVFLCLVSLSEGLAQVERIEPIVENPQDARDASNLTNELESVEEDAAQGEQAGQPQAEGAQAEGGQPSSFQAGVEALVEMMPLRVKSGKLFGKVKTDMQLMNEVSSDEMGSVWVLELEGVEQEQRLLSLGLFAAGEDNFYSGGEEISYADHAKLVAEWIEEKGMWADGEDWDWNRQGVSFGGRELISALIAWQLGEQELALEMVERLFAASRDPEHLIDFTVSAFAEYEFRQVTANFEKTQDWEKFAAELQALSGKYSRGWVGSGAMRLLAAKARQMAAGEMVVESQLGGVEFDQAQLERVKELVSGAAREFSLNALFEETAEKPLDGGLADFELLLALIGCEAFAPLPEAEEGDASETEEEEYSDYGMDGDYQLYYTAQQLLGMMTPGSSSSWQRERYYQSMQRPKTYSEMAQQAITQQLNNYTSPAEVEGESYSSYHSSSSYSSSDEAQELLNELLPLLRKSKEVFGANRAAVFLENGDVQEYALDYLVHQGEPEHTQMLMKRFGEDPLAEVEQVENLIKAYGVEAKELHEKLLAAIAQYKGKDGDQLEEAFYDNDHYQATSKAYKRTKDGDYETSFEALEKWGQGLAVHLRELSLELALGEFEKETIDEEAFTEMLQKLQRKQGLEPLLTGVINRAAEVEEQQSRERLLSFLVRFAYFSQDYSSGIEFSEEALVKDFASTIEAWKVLLTDERDVQESRWLWGADSNQMAHLAGLCFQLHCGKVSNALSSFLNYSNQEKYLRESLASALASVKAGELQPLTLAEEIEEDRREEMLAQFREKNWQQRLQWVETVSLAEEIALKEIWQEKGAEEGGGGIPVLEILGEQEFQEQWQGQLGKDFNQDYLLGLTEAFYALIEEKGQQQQLAGMYLIFEEEGWGGINLREMEADEVEDGAEYLADEKELKFTQNQVVFYLYDDEELMITVPVDLDEAARKEAMQPVVNLYFDEAGALREDLPEQLFLMPFAAQ